MGKVHKFRVNANPLTEVKSVLGVARFFRRHCEDVKGTTETQKAFCTRRFCSANIHRHAPQYILKILHVCLQPMNGDLWNMDQETKYRAAKKYMARKVFIRNVFFLAALAALYLHMSLTHSPIHHSSIQSDRLGNARASGQIISLISLHKQVGGYMRSDDFQLPNKDDGSASFLPSILHRRRVPPDVWKLFPDHLAYREGKKSHTKNFTRKP